MAVGGLPARMYEHHGVPLEGASGMSIMVCLWKVLLEARRGFGDCLEQ